MSFRPSWGLVGLGLAMAFSLFDAEFAHGQAPATFKDLRVLPKNITKPDLKAIMKAQAKALGVDCDFCHKEPNMEADTEKKTVARDMMRMVSEINKTYQKLIKGKITCMTCHRGEKEPPDPKDQK